MATTFSGTLQMLLGGVLDREVKGSGANKDELNFRDQRQLSSGTTADKANEIYQAQLTIAAAANQTLNFSDASLTNGIGQTITLVEMIAILIKNDDTVTNLEVKVTAGAGTVFLKDISDILVIPPGGVVLLMCTADPAWDDCSINIARTAGSPTVTTLTVVVVGRLS